MYCKECQEQLIAYAEGAMDARQAREVEEHLGHCFYCVEELAELRRTIRLCEMHLRHPSPGDGFGALKKAIESERKTSRLQPAPLARRSRVSFTQLSLAAFFLITMALTLELAVEVKAIIMPLHEMANTEALPEDAGHLLLPLAVRPYFKRIMEVDLELRDALVLSEKQKVDDTRGSHTRQAMIRREMQPPTP